MRGKKIWGRKRHILVDSMGHLLAVKVTGAQYSDQAGARALLEPHTKDFPRMQLLWGDSHYGGDFILWALIHLHWQVQPIKALTHPKEAQAGIDPVAQQEKKSFQVLPKRWVVERTFAWLSRVRRLSRDHEGLPRCSEAFIMLAASSRMLRLLVPSQPVY